MVTSPEASPENSFLADRRLLSIAVKPFSDRLNIFNFYCLLRVDLVNMDPAHDLDDRVIVISYGNPAIGETLDDMMGHYAAASRIAVLSEAIRS